MTEAEADKLASFCEKFQELTEEEKERVLAFMEKEAGTDAEN